MNTLAIGRKPDASMAWLSDEKILQIRDRAYREKIVRILKSIKENELTGIAYMENVLNKI